MKITTFTAEATILGTLRNVTYSGDGLTINKVAPTEVAALIELLEGAQSSPVPDKKAAVESKAPPAKVETKPVEVKTKQLSIPETAPDPKETKAGVVVPKLDADKVKAIAAANPASKPKAVPAKKAAPAPPPEPTPEEDISEELEEDVPVKTKANGANGHAAPAPFIIDEDDSSEEAATEGDLPEDIVNAKRLRDVLVWITKRGIKAKDAVIEECERLKEQIPVLARIPNLQERVGRTLGVIDEGEEFS